MGERLGQHFLNDQDILEDIVAHAELKGDEVVLEIGPGKGDLTRFIAPKARLVKAVEYDDELASSLIKNHLVPENVEVINQDIMEFDFSSLGPAYVIVANIPYYLTAKIIKRALGAQSKPKKLVLLIQKEVAQRLAAKPGKMSILAISAQLYGKVSLGIEVGPEKFDPPPKVKSQVVIIDTFGKPLFDVDEKLFFRVVKAGFGEKRKKLSNSLAGALGQPSAVIVDILQSMSVETNTRAQELSIEQWHQLCLELHNKGIV